MCFPDTGFQVTYTADTQGAPAGTDIPIVVREELLPHLSHSPLPESPTAQARLTEKIEQLQIQPLPTPSESGATRVDSVWYSLDDNPMGITRIRFSFDGDEGTWEYTNAQGDNTLRFGIGKMASDRFPQRNYFGKQIGVSPGIEYECLASAAWVDDQTLNLDVLITDIHLGALRASFAFKGDEISVYMTKQAEWFLDEYTGFAGGRKA